MAALLSSVLQDFGTPTSGTPPGAPPAEPGASAPVINAAFPPADIPAADILVERLAEAEARGERAGRDAARAEHERELIDLRTRAERQLSDERQDWVTEQGDALAASLNSAIEEFLTRIAEPVAEVLTSFTTASLRDAMVQDLSETVVRLISGGRGGRLRISGPADLLDNLRTTLGNCPAAIEWLPGEQVDVTLVANDSQIETDIAGWTERFAKTAK